MYRYKNGEFKISVRQLVEFIFRSGDLDNRRSGKREQMAMLEGTRIHKKLQKEMGAEYTAEVPMKLSIPIWIENSDKEENCDDELHQNIESADPDYFITVEGRADGIFSVEKEMAEKTIGVDEIKGMYADVEKMTEPIFVHKAQAMCYGYMQSLERDKCDVLIQMTYCDLDTERVKRFSSNHTFEELQGWFFALIRSYEKWCTFLYRHRKERTASAKALQFPFDYRAGQRDIVVAAYRTMQQKKTLFVQAPTGIGKTMAVLFPAVKTMGEERADKIFYLTAKTITRSVAKEAMEILQSKGLTASSLILTAKEKMCILEEMDCNPESCPYAKGHLDRVNDAVYELICTKQQISREDIWETAKKYQVCAFELSLDVSYWVDVVICDYNYVFDPNVRLQRYFSDGNPVDALFLIDEAHNLVERAREMYSVVLVKEDFIAARKVIREISHGMANKIERCNKVLLSMKRECEEFRIYEELSDIGPLVNAMEKLYEEFQRFSERYPSFYNKEFFQFFFTVRDFCLRCEEINEGYRIYSRFDGDGKFYVKLFCIDPSGQLSKSMNLGNGSILFSATMLPIGYYKKLLSGNQEDYAIYARSPFSQKNRLILIADDISTKYTRRTAGEYEKAARYIQKIVSAKTGNYMVFFPSYAYCREVEAYLGELEETFELIRQESGMSEEEREEFLERFQGNTICKEGETAQKTLIGLCVMGGIFSEGIDLKGKSLIGVIVLGTGLPQVGKERDLLKAYFEETGMDGFSFAYLYPGINKVLQAAGRLIRTDTDKGVIALLDERFLRTEYMVQLPAEWEDYRITKLSSVSEQVKQFWRQSDT